MQLKFTCKKKSGQRNNLALVTAIEVDTAESGQSFSDSRGSGCVENCKKKSRRLYFNAGHGGRRVFLDAEKPLVEDRHLARDFVFTKTKKKMFFLFRRSVKSIICSNFLELLDDYLRADKRSFEKKGLAGLATRRTFCTFSSPSLRATCCVMNLEAQQCACFFRRTVDSTE